MARTLGFSDGSSMSVDRTREAGERTLGFADGSSIKADRKPTIKEDAVGSSRPLLSKLIGGAAVAFSLRDLNDKQGESKVVNVRRSADNEEKIFKAKEVPIINKWVNGEQETTLPCDVASAESAYSLRKVKKSYNGPLVRLRRTMDNCEVDVYPDSDGKVSEKSRIVNIDGRLSTSESLDKLNTSATNLGKFIKPVGENLVIDNVANIVNSSTSAVTHYNTLFDQRAGGRACFYFSAQGSTRSSNSGESYHKYNQHYTSLRGMSPNKKKVVGDKIVVKYEYYVPSITPTTLNGQVGVTNTCRGIFAQTPYSPETVTPNRLDAHNIQLDTWLEGQTVIDIGNSSQSTVYDAIRLRLAFLYTGDGNVYYDTNRQNDNEINVDGHGCYLRNIRVYSDTVDAKVVTWYDQAVDNNGAVAITHDAQPNLVENGVLLSDGISFDGSNVLSFVDKTLTNASIFTVLDIDNSKSQQILLGGSSSTASAVMMPMITASTGTQVYKNATVGGAENGNSQFRNGSQITLSTRGNAVTELANQSKILFTMLDVDVPSASVLDGISQTPSDATTWGLKGTISELIIYNSDQSANRFKIESNINNYYGLYTFQGDGFVQTWYDQSGNGNHATQSDDTKEPQIVQNGNLVKVGNKASIKFDGTNDFLERATFTQGDLAQPSTAFAVAKLRVFVDANQKIFDGHANNKRNMIQLNTISNGQFAAYAGTVRASEENADANQHLLESRFNGDASRLIIDGVIKNTGSQGTYPMQGINIGANHDSLQNFWDGDIQEIIIYNSDLFTNRLAIEANINNQYQIYS